MAATRKCQCVHKNSGTIQDRNVLVILDPWRKWNPSMKENPIRFFLKKQIMVTANKDFWAESQYILHAYRKLIKLNVVFRIWFRWNQKAEQFRSFNT